MLADKHLKLVKYMLSSHAKICLLCFLEKYLYIGFQNEISHNF